MGWHRTGPERVAEWLRFFIRAGFLIAGIIVSILVAYVAFEAGMLFVGILEETFFQR